MLSAMAECRLTVPTGDLAVRSRLESLATAAINSNQLFRSHFLLVVNKTCNMVHPIMAERERLYRKEVYAIT